MKINRKTRLQLKLQSGLFILLFIAAIGMLAWLSTRFSFSVDLTANQRNSLSAASERLLESIDREVRITAFVSPLNELKPVFDSLFERYQALQPNVVYQSVNPDLAPEKLRDYDIQQDGEIVIEIGERRENLRQITESTVTNAIARLQRQGERWAIFLEGHGERNPYGEANFDLQFFAARLAQKGFLVENLNLLQTTEIPDNTDILVIADSVSELLPGEVDIIRSYVEQGGNLLWLADSDNDSLQPLAETLELEFLPGVIVDSSTQLLGLTRVDFALVATYPRHAITRAVQSLSLYPRARALQFNGEDSAWEGKALLATQARSWNETSELQGQISQGDQPGELAGPLTLGYSLARSLQQDDGNLLTQRVVVIGDADFLSNQYLGNGANLDIGLNIFNWLSHDDNLISISPRSAPDTRLELSQTSQLVIALTFLLILPVALLASGIRIWLVRRRR